MLLASPTKMSWMPSRATMPGVGYTMSMFRRARSTTPTSAIQGGERSTEEIAPSEAGPSRRPAPIRAKAITPQAAKELVAELLDAEKFGTRGEAWFLAQGVMILLVLFPPSGVRQIVDTIGGALVVCGLALISLGIASLGTNLTPLPQPRDEHSLVTDGAYEIVRHPMYSGVVLGALGLSLATGDEARLALSGLLFWILDQKATYEEEFLVERYVGQYDAYRKKVKKLIPWLY